MRRNWQQLPYCYYIHIIQSLLYADIIIIPPSLPCYTKLLCEIITYQKMSLWTFWAVVVPCFLLLFLDRISYVTVPFFIRSSLFLFIIWYNIIRQKWIIYDDDRSVVIKILQSCSYISNSKGILYRWDVARASFYASDVCCHSTLCCVLHLRNIHLARRALDNCNIVMEKFMKY